MKYKITPIDIANYFLMENLRISKENEILKDLFDNHNAELASTCRKDYLRFRKEVYCYVDSFDLSEEEFSEAKLILEEAANGTLPDFGENEAYDVFAFYFKIIKLQIMYSQQQYKKIKLRTLLRDFGYQRRSNLLIDNINHTLRVLKLKTYLRGNEKCKVSEIDLDDMLILRLKK